MGYYKAILTRDVTLRNVYTRRGVLVRKGTEVQARDTFDKGDGLTIVARVNGERVEANGFKRSDVKAV